MFEFILILPTIIVLNVEDPTEEEINLYLNTTSKSKHNMMRQYFE